MCVLGGGGGGGREVSQAGGEGVERGEKTVKIWLSVFSKTHVYVAKETRTLL